MKRVEIDKSEAGPAIKQEILGEKLMRFCKRGGQTTPVAPFWRTKESLKLSPPPAAPHSHSVGGDGEVVEKGILFQIPRVSARKLGASLWELHHYKLPLYKMHQSRLRRPCQNQQNDHQQVYKDRRGLEPHDPLPGLLDMPGSSSRLKSQVVASLMQLRRPIGSSSCALQPVSPASYGSSMEIATYNAAVTPGSSIECNGKAREANYSLRTSTELLKVLNRIWSLEEQHASNISLVKALKKELDHARLRVKDLVREQRADRREMDELMKQIAEGKRIRKNIEQESISAVVQSIRNELEDERKLRKRSESLHRKLAHELLEVKSTLASVSKDLDKEKKTSSLLEDLCDEFAHGIRDYESELHAFRQKSNKDWDERGGCDQLILHVSESWLDERVQMKLGHGNGLGENKSAIDKLSSEIESFVRMRKNGVHKIKGGRMSSDPIYLRNSLESIPLNLVASAPQDEDDSAGSDSNCFELGKPCESHLNHKEDEFSTNHDGETLKQKKAMETPGIFERKTGPNPSSLQMKFEEQMAQTVSNFAGIDSTGNSEQVKAGTKNSVEPVNENSSKKKCESEGLTGLNTNYMMENLIRNRHLLSDGRNNQPEENCSTSVWRSHPSPIRQWTEKLPPHDLNISESFSNLPPELRDNTLKAKLLEARARGQTHRSRSRLKAAIVGN